MKIIFSSSGVNLISSNSHVYSTMVLVRRTNVSILGMRGLKQCAKFVHKVGMTGSMIVSSNSKRPVALSNAVIIIVKEMITNFKEEMGGMN